MSKTILLYNVGNENEDLTLAIGVSINEEGKAGLVGFDSVEEGVRELAMNLTFESDPISANQFLDHTRPRLCQSPNDGDVTYFRPICVMGEVRKWEPMGLMGKDATPEMLAELQPAYEAGRPFTYDDVGQFTMIELFRMLLGGGDD